MSPKHWKQHHGCCCCGTTKGSVSG
jgi:hypothetical protein